MIGARRLVCVRTVARTKADETVETDVIGWQSVAISDSPNMLFTGYKWPLSASPVIQRPSSQPDLRIRRLGVRIPPSAPSERALRARPLSLTPLGRQRWPVPHRPSQRNDSKWRPFLRLM